MDRTTSFALLALIAIPACGSASELGIAEEQREIWQTSAVTEYTIEVASELAGVRYHTRVDVRDGEISTLGLPDQPELASDHIMPDFSIDGLFELVITALENGDEVVVEYDPELGHPISAEIVRDGRVDHFEVEVFSIERLGPPDMEIAPPPPAEPGSPAPDVGNAPDFELSR